jgi:hypothetical protein
MKRALKWACAIILTPVIAIVLLMAAFYIPPVQRWVVKEISEYASEKSGLNINPAYLTTGRTSDVQAAITSEFYHYTMDLPKGAKLIGGEVNIEYTKYDLGSINIKIKQKGRRLLVTRQLQLRKALITKQDYRNFRQLMIDWNSHKELLFSL